MTRMRMPASRATSGAILRFMCMFTVACTPWSIEQLERVLQRFHDAPAKRDENGSPQHEESEFHGLLLISPAPGRAPGRGNGIYRPRGALRNCTEIPRAKART